MDAGQGHRGHRLQRGRDLRHRQDAGREPARLHHLGDGPDAAHQRQRDRARVEHPDARARQRRALRRRLQHLPRPRQRAGRDRLPGRRAGLLDALVARLERRSEVDRGSLRARHAGQARHDGVALDRRRHGEERAHRPAEQPARHLLLGPCAEQPVARPGDGRGDEEARADGGARSLSVGERGDVRDGEEGRRLPAAGGDAARDRGFGDLLEPLAAVAPEGDRPGVRVAHRPHDHVPARAEAGLRRPAGRQEGRQAEHQAGQGQGRRGAVDGRYAARNQPRRLDHRLHRPDARAAAGAHAQHAPSSARAARTSTRSPRRNTTSRATITACRGPATAPPRSSTRARRTSTTPRST